MSVLVASCLLSLLCFLPAPDDLSYNEALHSSNVSTSFLCYAIASFPMALDCLLDLLSHLRVLKLGSTYDHMYLVERWVILIGFIYPTIGFFCLKAWLPDHLGRYYSGLTNSQSIWLGGTFLSIIHSSKMEIWTFKWISLLLTILVAAVLLSIYVYALENLVIYVFHHLLVGVECVVFIWLYIKTINSIRRKNYKDLSSGDYFCIMYSTLIMVIYIVVIVIGSVMYSIVGFEITIIYVNLSSIVVVTLATMIRNRRVEKIKVESTEQSLAMKQAFVRYLSHEMRTPINVVLVGLMVHQQHLEDKNMFDAESKESVSDMRAAMDVALETLNEALICEKLQSKVMVLDKSIVNPLSFIQSSTSMFKTSAISAGIRLILPDFVENLTPESSCIEVDVHKMSQVMRNFISNAIKFTPSGGAITVSLRSGDLRELMPAAEIKHLPWIQSLFSRKVYSAPGDLWLEVSVKDEGIGIAKENLPRIFNEVYQINPNQNQGGKGSGMGLYICKGIAELHGGRVMVHSDGLGHGCCFKVFLPLLPRPVGDQPATSVAPKSSILSSPAFRNDGSNKADGETTSKRLTISNTFDTSSQLIDIETGINMPPVVSNPHRTAGGDLFIQRVPPPLGSDSGAETPTRHSYSRDNNSETPMLLEPTTRRSQSSLISIGNRGRLRGLKMLMVDDFLVNLKMCAKLFRNLGAEVDEAPDGIVARDMMQDMLHRHEQQRLEDLQSDSDLNVPCNNLVVSMHNRGYERPKEVKLYDVVVMDNVMPRMSGLEACSAMRRLGFRGCIVGLTGNALERDVAEYLTQGADAALKKPLDLNELFFQILKR